MMTVWLVISDQGGAHEASCVYSVWSTKELAEGEIVRLRSIPDFSPGFYSGGELSVGEVVVDQPSEEIIE